MMQYTELQGNAKKEIGILIKLVLIFLVFSNKLLLISKLKYAM